MIPVSIIAGQALKQIALGGIARVLGSVQEKVLGRIFRPQPPSLSDRLHSIVPQVMQNAPELLNLQQTYLDRQVARQVELGELQLQQTRLQLEMEVEAARAARAGRLVELREQDLADRKAYSQEYLKLLRIATKAKITAERDRIQANFDLKNWSGVLSREEALQIFETEAQAGRLLMLVPPPLVVEDELLPKAFNQSLQTEIRKNLARLFERYYPDQGLCPVSFYGGFFARFASDAEVRQQEMTFSGIPTGLITAEITDYEVHFSLNLWGLDQPLAVELDPFNWEEFREAVLQEEGIDDRKSWRLVRQAIVSLYKLYGAFLADVYYLSVNPLHEPQLFELNPELGAVWSEELLTQLREIQDRCIAAYLEELRQQAGSKAEEQRQLEAAATEERKKQEVIESRCRLWETALTQHYTLPGHNNSTVHSVKISSNGHQLISGGGDRTVKIWDLKTRKLLRTLSQHIDSVFSVAISSDNKTTVSSSGDNTIKVWDFQSGKLIYDIGQYNAIMSLDISADGSIIVGGSYDKTVKVWWHHSLNLIHTLKGHEDWVRSVSISPDCLTLISGSDDKTVKVWDLKTGCLRQTLSGHRKWIFSVKISPDNQSIISGSHDKTIRIWDLKTGELKRTLTGHTDAICSVDISADCRTIVSGSEDKTIKIWDFETGELIQTLTGHSEAVRSVCISPDSQTIASGSSDRTIKIWHVEPPTTI